MFPRSVEIQRRNDIVKLAREKLAALLGVDELEDPLIALGLVENR